jgi:hypothetical protein
VIKSWRTTIAPQAPAELLARLGVRTLLQAGAAICGKLVRVSYAHCVHQATEAAALGATLLAGVLPSSISHPQRAIDAATYTPEHLGGARGTPADVFRDPHELNLPDVLLGLEAVSRALLAAGLAFNALVPLALWEWAAARVSRNAAATIRCRLSRADALCALGLPHAALRVTASLMHGADLPHPHARDLTLAFRDADGRPLPPPPPPPPLAAVQPPGAAANAAALALLTTGGVHPAVERFYGPWACARIALARSRLLLLLGGVPHLWPGARPDSAAAAPTPAEADLLAASRTLLGQVVVATCSGEAVVQPLPPPAADAAAADSKAAKAAKGKAPKGGKKAAPVAAPAQPSSTADVEVTCTLEAWHLDILMEGRMLVRSHWQHE